MTLDYTVRPLSDRTWLRPPSEREVSRFDTAWPKTLKALEREITALDGHHVVLGLDVPERHIRADGKLRANARAFSPAVEVAFESRHGPLLYRCDQFVKAPYRRREETSDWQHNVRAIALTLEALRAVDRYGSSRSGEQYRGYRALPAGRGDAATGMTATDALGIICRSAGGAQLPPSETGMREWTQRNGVLIVRQARAAVHPDRHDGDRGQWNLVDNAVQTLQQAGWLPKELT